MNIVQRNSRIVACLEKIRGDRGLSEFLAFLESVDGDELRRAVLEVNELVTADLAQHELFVKIPLAPLIASLMGVRQTSYKLVKITSLTKEDALMDEYKLGIFGQYSLGMKSYLTLRRNIRR
jgi:hypothetical protein